MSTFFQIKVFPSTEVDVDKLIEITERLNDIARPNFDEKPDKPVRGYYVAPGRILCSAETVDHVRPVDDDIAELSKAYPEFEFEFMKRWDTPSNAEIEDLSSFWKGIYQDGALLSDFVPAPISWVPATPVGGGWFV